LGNITGSILPADVFTRFCKLRGYDAIYVTGSDVHGTATEVAAKKAGLSPKEFSYQKHKEIKDFLIDKWNIDFTNYSITDSDENKKVTVENFNALYKNGYILEKEVEQAYCKKCKSFLADRYIEGKCPKCGGLARGDQCDDCGELLEAKDIIAPYCVVCKSKDVEFRKSKHLFIDLPKLKKEITNYVKSHPEWPDNAKNFSVNFLNKIEPRCITRDLKWGISVPLKGFKEKVFYVWFDNIQGYLSATYEAGKKDWWFDKNTEIYEFIGKDNIVFHTIIFPAILIGSKLGYTLPTFCASSEFVISKGMKFSKSRGVGVTVEDIFKLRSSDYWRYALMAHYPEKKDVDFSLDTFQKRVNSELADSIGNFINRTLVFIKNKLDGEIPKGTLDKTLEKKVKEKVEKIEKLLENAKFKTVTQEIVSIADLGNVYFNENEPWKNKDNQDAILYNCANICKTLAIVLQPFIPETSDKIWKQVGLKGKKKWDDAKKFNLKSGKIGKPKPLFKKIDDKELKKWKKLFEKPKEGDNLITLEQFSKIELRVAEIKEVDRVKGSDKLLKLQVDVGDEQKQIVAGIKEAYKPEELIGKQIIIVNNMKSAKLAGVESKGMLLAAEPTVLLTVGKKVKNGAKIK